MKLGLYDLGNGLIVCPEVPDDCLIPNLWIVQNLIFKTRAPDIKDPHWESKFDLEKATLMKMVSCFNEKQVVSIEPHPPEVIDVDPEIIENMRERLK